MCTLTYIPTKDNGFILTSNRDEKSTRLQAIPPRTSKQYGQYISYPQDKNAGGTWFAATVNRSVCLLNGAAQKHMSNPPYKSSRGLVLLDSFQFTTAALFAAQYDLTNIEPFTLVFVEHNPRTVIAVQWDGQTPLLKEFSNDDPHIWSSVTLYEEAVRMEREHWFNQYLQLHPAPTQADLLHFHKFAGKGDSHNALLMNRNDVVMTVSISSIEYDSQSSNMLYLDLFDGQEYVLPINGIEA